MSRSKNQNPSPIVFRLRAEIEVAADMERAEELFPHQRALLDHVLTHPEVKREMCRLSLVAELAGLGAPLADLFPEVSDDEVYNCATTGLPQEEKAYWEGLKADSWQMLGDELMPVFALFNCSLKRRAMEEAQASS